MIRVWLVFLSCLTSLQRITAMPSNATNGYAKLYGNIQSGQDRKPLRFVLAGDSTTSSSQPNNPSSGNLCHGGWGSDFLSHLEPNSFGINLGVCSMSTVTYFEKGFWDKVLELIRVRKDEYRKTIVTISFGPNDQKQHVSPGHFMDNLIDFVKQVNDTGAMAVLITPISRTEFGQDGKVPRSFLWAKHITKYAADLTGVPLIDLNTASRELYEHDGYEKSLQYRMRPSDTLHLSPAGGKMIGELMCRLFKEKFHHLQPYFIC